jgi:hypothetical protein
MIKDALFSVAVPVEPPMTVFTIDILYFGFSVGVTGVWPLLLILEMYVSAGGVVKSMKLLYQTFQQPDVT